MSYRSIHRQNLRSDYAHPVSFRHDATGYGIDVDVDVVQKMSDAWSLDARFKYINYKADNGTDTTFPTTGGSSATRLNEVNRESFLGGIDAIYAF